MKISLKRILVIMTFIFGFALSSCSEKDYFSDDLLKDAFLSDISKPENAEEMHLYNTYILMYNSSEESYMNYVEYLYQFLKDKDFKYLGCQSLLLKSEGFFLGSWDIYEFVQSTVLNDHLIDTLNYSGGSKYIRYDFVYGNEIDSDTKILDAVDISIIYDSSKEYNVKIQIVPQYIKEWNTYYIDGSSFKYQISIETTEYLYDVNIPELAAENEGIYIKIKPEYKDKIKVYINGGEIPEESKQPSDEYILYTYYIYIREDVYISFELIN